MAQFLGFRPGVQTQPELPAHPPTPPTPIRAEAAGLHRSHYNAGCKPCLQPTLQLKIPNPLREARDRIHILKDTSRIRFRCTTMGTPSDFFFFFFKAVPKAYKFPGQGLNLSCSAANTGSFYPRLAGE